MDGLLIIDKPIGPTSHDVVERVRRATGERHIGHTGTLDPSASGVLPLVLGRATRLARFLAASDKTYTAVIQLGVETDSYDAAGRQVGDVYAGARPDRDAIERALQIFRGTFMQQPPVFSAKKIAGVRSHRLARRRLRPCRAEDERIRPFDRLRVVPSEVEGRGEASALERAGGGAPAPVEKKLAGVPGLPGRSDEPLPVRVTVRALELLAVEDGRVTLNVTASAGFYVRSLAHDLGRWLGTGAHLAELRRTRAGESTIDDAIPLAIVEREAAAVGAALIPPRRMLQSVPAVTLTVEGARRARHGRNLGPGDVAGPLVATGDDLVRLLDESGELLGIGEPAAGLLHPAVVLV